MLLNAHTEDEALPVTLGPHAMKFGALFSVVLAFELAYAMSGLVITPFSTDPAARSAVSNVTTIGTVLFTTYSFAFEATSILILVAMLGAVVIAGKPRSER